MRLAAAITALALAACSGAPDKAAEAPVNAIEAITPEAAPTPAPTAASAIPPTLQGRWGLVPADCDPARDDNKGLMTITADGLAFYESRARVDRVIVRPDRVALDTVTTGEGMTENRRYEFLTAADGKKLTRVESRLPDLVYTRCPDLPS